MIIAIIIDNELNSREFLQKLITKHFSEKITVVATCDSVDTGVQAIHKYAPELVFVDIQMPNQNGFKLFSHFETTNFEVIFTTAFKDYAIDAIKYSALDYLLKPINYIDLLAAIKRFEERKINFINQKKTEALLENLGSNNNSFNKIALPTHNGYELIKLNNIVYCQSESNYCKIICSDGGELLISKTLKHVEELIENNLFIRIHKSYLVNLNYVINYDKTADLKVTLSTGIQLPVSVRRKEHFLNRILQKE